MPSRSLSSGSACRRFRQRAWALALTVTAITAASVSCTSHRVVLSRQAPATLYREPPGHETAVVTRVIDGDTIEVNITGRAAGPGAGEARIGGAYDVRLIGIDTPESVKPSSPVECFGRESSAAATALLEGVSVKLVKDVEETDGYDRLLRYVYLGQELANARLVANGYAAAFTYPPNVRHTDLFVSLQRQARQRELGLWSPETCSGVP
jgi:endonuclease YncB( thermonuclease family)